jgi:outer membrane protein assembly factor BamB/predicted MPP superfamily phosphohydrolase
MSFRLKLGLIIFITLCFFSGASGIEQLNTTYHSSSEFSFVVLSDLHVSPGEASDSSLNRIVREINRSAVDFIIVTGDLSNTGSDAELFAVKRALDKITKPFYVIPGNHDTNWSESAGLTVNRLWGNDRFVFSHKGFRMLGFNTGPFMKMGDGHVKQEDLRWLEKQTALKGADEQLIAFAHYPIADGLDNGPKVTGILKSAGCRLVFCGHGHSLRLYNFDGIPGIMCRSVILGKSPDPGYSIITLRNDSVLVYNKVLTHDTSKPEISLSYMHPDAISKLPVSPLPDFKVNDLYPDVTVAASWSDSASVFSGPCLVKESVLVYGNSLGYVSALNTVNYKLLWQRKIQGPVYSTPVTDGNVVVLGTVDGRIIGLNSVNGNLLWEVKTGSPVLAEGVIEGGSVYIGGGDSLFYRINTKTGKVIWTFPVSGLIQGKPALAENAVVFGAWDRYLYCIDRKTGALKWKWDNGKPQVLYSPGNVFPVCSGNRVFVVAPDRFMTAIDINTGKAIWRNNSHHVRESMGASPDGSVVYAKLMEDTIIAVPAGESRFRTLWKADAGFGYEHSPCPVFADNRQVMTGTRDGLIVSVDPVTSKVLWKYKAGTSSVNKIVSDSRHILWVTLMEGRILGIKTKELY